MCACMSLLAYGVLRDIMRGLKDKKKKNVTSTHVKMSRN